MMILNKLFFEAGGYTASDLAKASRTERRQILQLGSAVIFSIIASMVSWGYASTLLMNPDSGLFLKSLSLIGTALVVLLVSLSINRNLIFYSDMREEKKAAYSGYTPLTNEPGHNLIYLRVALVLIVSLLNFMLFSRSSEALIGLLAIAMLGLFELYPLLLKKQMGQTILGRRMQEKLIYQKERSKLKGEEYAQEIKASERKIHTQRDDKSAHDHVRLIK